MSLEALGRPTAVVVTTEFLHEADMQKQALGLSDLAPVVIAHPLSTLTEAEIDTRAAEAAPQCLAVWRGVSGQSPTAGRKGAAARRRA